MLRLLVASGNIIEGLLAFVMIGTSVYTFVTVGITASAVVLATYGCALVFLHAASTYYALNA